MRTSTNKFTRKRFTKTTNRWKGDNMNDDQFGFDEVNSGGPVFGSGDIGGTSHFRKRTANRINHK